MKEKNFFDEDASFITVKIVGMRGSGFENSLMPKMIFDEKTDFVLKSYCYEFIKRYNKTIKDICQ